MSPNTDPGLDAWLAVNLGPCGAAQLAAARDAWRALPDARRRDIDADFAAVESWLAAMMVGRIEADSPRVVELLERHRALVAEAWGAAVEPEAYATLADIYEAHPGFVARFETRAEGFTAWLTDAMRAHARRLGATGDAP